MQKLTNWLLGKRVLMLFLIVLFYYVPYLSWFSLVLAALFTLANNVRISLLALAALLVPELINNFWHETPFAWFIPLKLAFFWAAAAVLRHYDVSAFNSKASELSPITAPDNAWSQVCNLTAAVTIVVIPLVYLLNPQIQLIWSNFWGWLLNSIGLSLHTYAPMLGQDGIDLPIWTMWLTLLDELKASHVMVLLPKISTGVLISGYFWGELTTLMIVRAWFLSYQKRTHTTAQELQRIRLHMAATLAFLLVLVVPNASLACRLDLLCALGILFFLAGLSLVHYLLHSWGNRIFWMGIIALYVLLIFMPITMSLFLIVLAIVDSIVDVRKRLMREVIHDGNHPA
ncbi:MAG: hypothetical protein K2Q14_06140 [Gammaproteobacteria bacterium]|nr:hypothetical protein [Gammaproteobacteria bacterium]